MAERLKLLTQDAQLICEHLVGHVDIAPSQSLVTVAQRALLVEKDPEARKISGCPHIGAGIKPCLLTLPVRVGYSTWVRVEGRRVCLDTVVGLTDGTPPGIVEYKVRAPGQDFVAEAAA
jgi:hypothetical protein